MCKVCKIFMGLLVGIGGMSGKSNAGFKIGVKRSSQRGAVTQRVDNGHYDCLLRAFRGRTRSPGQDDRTVPGRWCNQNTTIVCG
jgi:hypothetical protein